MKRVDIITVHRFRIKKYWGVSLKILFLKIEVISFKTKFNLRVEISNW